MGSTPGVRDEVKGSSELDVAPQRLWEVLDSPERLQALLPGVRCFEAGSSAGSFAVTLVPRTSLGPVPVATRWSRTRREPPTGLAYRVSGRSGENLVELLVALELRPAGDVGSMVSWTCQATATGTLRSVTQRVLAGVVTNQVREVLAAAEREALGSEHPR